MVKINQEISKPDNGNFYIVEQFANGDLYSFVIIWH
jgi:hypothetical protein